LLQLTGQTIQRLGQHTQGRGPVKRRNAGPLCQGS
jgi:hypothetical protein